MRRLKHSLILLVAILLLSSAAFDVSLSYAKKNNDIDINSAINKAIPLFLSKRYKKSRKIFLKVLKKEPNNIVARYYIAEIMFTDVRRYDDAAKQFKTVLKLNDKEKSARFRIRNQYIINNSILKIGLVYLKNGQNKKAIEYIKTFLKNDSDSPSRVKALNSLAVAYSNQDDYEDAIVYLEEALSIDRENLIARFNLSSINSKLIYYNTGNELSLNGKHDEAAREFVKALDVDPFFVAAHFMLGLEHKSLRNYIDAQNELLRAYAINPDYHRSYRILEELADISTYLNEFDKAKEYIEKSLELNSKFPHSYNVLGKINMHEKDYQSAIDNFQKAVDIREVEVFTINLKKAQRALLNSSQQKQDN